MNTVALSRILGLVLGVLFAIWCGLTVGAGQHRMVLISILLLAGIALSIAARERIWLIIPLFGAIGGTLTFMPARISIQETGILVAFGCFLIFKALKIVNFKPQYRFIDFIFGVLLLYIFILYCRFPVGTFLFKSELVGGRPYFAVVVATLGYWVLVRSQITPSIASRLPLWIALCASIGMFTGLITTFIPGMAVLAVVYSNFGAIESVDLRTSRFGFFHDIGTRTFQALCSYFKPLQMISPARPLIAILTIFSLVGVLISGYRSSFLLCAFFFLVTSLYRRKFAELAVIGTLGVITLATMPLVQEVYPLPYGIQRSLTFLPGDWSPEAVKDAEETKQWRIEIWKRLFESDYYLKDRWFGDGFGFSSSHLAATARQEDHVGSSIALQEHFLFTGDLHSGPLSTIFFVGYVGLALLLFLFFLMIRLAHQLILRAAGTPFEPWCLFLGAGFISFVLIFLIVYGSFKDNLPYFIITLGLLKMTERGLNQYLEQQRENEMLERDPIASS